MWYQFRLELLSLLSTHQRSREGEREPCAPRSKRWRITNVFDFVTMWNRIPGPSLLFLSSQLRKKRTAGVQDYYCYYSTHSSPLRASTTINPESSSSERRARQSYKVKKGRKRQKTSPFLTYHPSAIRLDSKRHSTLRAVNIVFVVFPRASLVTFGGEKNTKILLLLLHKTHLLWRVAQVTQDRQHGERERMDWFLSTNCPWRWSIASL